MKYDIEKQNHTEINLYSEIKKSRNLEVKENYQTITCTEYEE